MLPNLISIVPKNGSQNKASCSFKFLKKFLALKLHFSIESAISPQHKLPPAQFLGDFTLQRLQDCRLHLLVHQSDLGQFLLLQQQLHQPLSQESTGSCHHTHVASQRHRGTILSANEGRIRSWKPQSEKKKYKSDRNFGENFMPEERRDLLRSRLRPSPLFVKAET